MQADCFWRNDSQPELMLLPYIKEPATGFTDAFDVDSGRGNENAMMKRARGCQEARDIISTRTQPHVEAGCRGCDH